MDKRASPVGGISLESSEISVRRDKDFPMIMKTVISRAGPMAGPLSGMKKC